MERQRDCYFDNAKFFLILLVVLGHGMELINGAYISTLYSLIYLFHMPAFVLITGYFSKAGSQPRVGGLLAQYMVFQTLYLLFDRFVLRGDLRFTYTTPYWILWFLLSAISWKILTPLMARYPFTPVLVVLLALAVLAGYDASLTRYLSLSRTLVFFPFFWLGYHARREHFSRLKRLPVYVPLAVFGFSFFMLHNVQLFPRFFLYATNPYEALKMDGWQAGFSRLLCLGWGFILVCGFFALIPEGKTWVSRLGQRTNQVFLLHGFVVRYLPTVLPLPLLLDSTLDRLLFFLALTGLLMLLLYKPVAVLFAPLLDPLRFIGSLKQRLTRGT